MWFPQAETARCVCWDESAGLCLQLYGPALATCSLLACMCVPPALPRKLQDLLCEPGTAWPAWCAALRATRGSWIASLLQDSQQLSTGLCMLGDASCPVSPAAWVAQGNSVLLRVPAAAAGDVLHACIAAMRRLHERGWLKEVAAPSTPASEPVQPVAAAPLAATSELQGGVLPVLQVHAGYMGCIRLRGRHASATLQRLLGGRLPDSGSGSCSATTASVLCSVQDPRWRPHGVTDELRGSPPADQASAPSITLHVRAKKCTAVAEAEAVARAVQAGVPVPGAAQQDLPAGQPGAARATHAPPLPPAPLAQLVLDAGFHAGPCGLRTSAAWSDKQVQDLVHARRQELIARSYGKSSSMKAHRAAGPGNLPVLVQQLNTQPGKPRTGQDYMLWCAWEATRPLWLELARAGATAIGQDQAAALHTRRGQLWFPRDFLEASAGQRTELARLATASARAAARPAAVGTPWRVLRMPEHASLLAHPAVQHAINSTQCMHVRVRCCWRGSLELGALLAVPEQADIDAWNAAGVRWAGVQEPRGVGEDCAPSRRVIGVVTAGVQCPELAAAVGVGVLHAQEAAALNANAAAAVPVQAIRAGMAGLECAGAALQVYCAESDEHGLGVASSGFQYAAVAGKKRGRAGKRASDPVHSKTGSTAGAQEPAVAAAAAAAAGSRTRAARRRARRAKQAAAALAGDLGPAAQAMPAAHTWWLLARSPRSDTWRPVQVTRVSGAGTEQRR